MSIATVVTRGYGSFGSIADVVTRGYIEAIGDTAWMAQAKNLIHRRRHRSNSPRKRPPPPPHYHR